LPALVLADCVARLCAGVLADESCWRDESHGETGLLEHPHYTMPREWNGRGVPEVLLSGHHANIEKWRRQQSLLKTAHVRPELLNRAQLSDEDIGYLLDNDVILHKNHLENS